MVNPDARQKQILTRSAEQRTRLAERLLPSVVPLFIEGRSGRPERMGSCVLAEIGGNCFAFTAGHVLERAGTLPLSAPAASGKLVQLPSTMGFSTNPDGKRAAHDVGVLPLRRSGLAPFSNFTFLRTSEIDAQHLRDNEDDLARFYYVLGHPLSKSQCTISHREKRIHQVAFQFSTHPPAAIAYANEALDPGTHLLLEYDHKNVRAGGEHWNPPNLRGVSGGGVFLISRVNHQGPLVAIATMHRKESRLLVTTRIGHFVEVAAALYSTHHELFV